LSIELVIAIAAAAAIVGDNIGYGLGRRYGRRLIERPGRTKVRRQLALARGEQLFDRHGPKAVFLGRWIALLRIWAAWLAGIAGMRWRSFLLWNALGGIGWALFFGLLGYYGGEATAELVARLGVGAALVVVAAAVVLWVMVHRRQGRA
jgi:membrane protein DedA with SNARE-associated domain